MLDGVVLADVVRILREAPVDLGVKEITDVLSVHLDPVLKGILRAEALAAGTSVSALVREWIDERLDLPVS